MNGFIEWLGKVNQQDSRLRAELKRSLAFEPGTYPRVFPYIEPWTSSKKLSENQRTTYYMIAGLWAMHWSESLTGASGSFGKACLEHKISKSASSMDGRFMNLLDADKEQLPNRLRHMVAMLKNVDIDFSMLLSDVMAWSDENKRVQIRWAREYFGSSVDSDDRRADNEKDIS